MIPIEQHISFIENKILKLKGNQALAKSHKMQNFIIDNEIAYLSDLLSVLNCISNAKALQFANCEVCGDLYITKREKQAVCSGKCRIKLHRMKKQEVNHD